jgi:hypothetical protein
MQVVQAVPAPRVLEEVATITVHDQQTHALATGLELYAE